MVMVGGVLLLSLLCSILCGIFVPPGGSFCFADALTLTFTLQTVSDVTDADAEYSEESVRLTDDAAKSMPRVRRKGRVSDSEHLFYS
jgi:hypothetical protein